MMIAALTVWMMSLMVAAVAQPWSIAAFGALVPARGRFYNKTTVMYDGMTRMSDMWIGVFSSMLKPIGPWWNLSAEIAAKFLQGTL